MQGMAERRVAKLAGLSVDELWLCFQRVNLVNYHPGRKGRHEKHVHKRTGWVLSLLCYRWWEQGGRKSNSPQGLERG
jgi:hypothetical protein